MEGLEELLYFILRLLGKLEHCVIQVRFAQLFFVRTTPPALTQVIRLPRPIRSQSALAREVRHPGTKPGGHRTGQTVARATTVGLKLWAS